MKEHFFLAFKNIRRRKLRSWLTILGIFIGIAAVVSLISLGQGLQEYIGGEFEKLGKDKIIIQPKTIEPPGSATSKSLMLTTEDLKIIEDINGVEWAIGMLYKLGQIEFKKELEVTYITGIEPNNIKRLSEIQSFEILEGRLLKTGDKFKVIIGYNHAYGKIWEKQIGLGNTIEIEDIDFKVIGIMKKIGNPIDDAQVYLPKEVLKDILDLDDEESWIMAKAAIGSDPANVAETIERKLRKSRGERENQETFSVQTSGQLLQTFQNIFGVVQAVLIGIAAISLLVGGIGIMNTMYTTVLERTKEIGTMKAVGAQNSDILLIFLFESGLLGLVGGIIGILIGVGIGKSVEYIATIQLGTPLLQASFGFPLLLGALVFSFIVGSISGILPAIQAAKLKPADALRYE